MKWYHREISWKNVYIGWLGWLYFCIT